MCLMPKLVYTKALRGLSTQVEGLAVTHYRSGKSCNCFVKFTSVLLRNTGLCSLTLLSLDQGAGLLGEKLVSQFFPITLESSRCLGLWV